MIIFDLDGTLADCEHRCHFVDPEKSGCIKWIDTQTGKTHWGIGYVDGIFQHWKPDWKSFYEACDKDTPIQPVIDVFIHLTQAEPFNHDVQVWSGRCESVREKTLKWLVNLTGYCEDYQYWDRRLKMRPIGDSTPDDKIKERWLDEYLSLPTMDFGKNGIKPQIEFVFDNNPQAVRMWRRKGIFVFDCNQQGREF